ncbi:MAG: hypothetical protein QOK29_2911, partial [Rhodospirillaceae bacterium]|nr:hypothetical protein [Rhodospirillaceae bacterium]
MKPRQFRLGAKLGNALARLRALPASRWMSPVVPPEFARWIASNEPAPDRWAGMSGQELPYRPLISIILPVYRIPHHVLTSTLRSITRQTYPRWQACIAYADVENQENWELIRGHADGDSRFHVRRMEGNRGISSNSNEALRLATGEFIALLDHDDEIAPWALYIFAKKIAENPDADFLYSDKDCITEDGSKRLNPLFKPQWSPEMLYSVNYLTHLNVMRRSVVEDVGGFRPETDGAQDWDLFFRVTERSRRILRVEGILYHWRMLATSTSTGAAAKPYAARAQLRTVGDRLRRLGLPAEAEPSAESGFRIRWHPSPWQADIIVHSNGGDRSRIDRLLSGLAQDRVRSVIVAADPGARPEDFPHGRMRLGPRLKVLPEGLPGSAGGGSSLAQLLTADVVAFVSAEVARFSDE